MIVVYPSASLEKKSAKISNLNSEVEETISILKKDLLSSEVGVGLSAPQVGKNLAVFATKDHAFCSEKGHDCQIKIYINPKIIDTFSVEKSYPQIASPDGQREDFYEGCLSFPDLYGTVKRWLKIKVNYQTLTEKGELESKEEILEDLWAIVFQHELDHLNGELFVDRVKKEKGKLFYQKKGGLEKISWTEFEKLFK